MNINICFGINNEYCQHCAVTITSILINSNRKDNYHFHIITDYLSEQNIAALNRLKYIRSFKLTVYTVSVKDFENININNSIGLASLYRCKALELLKCKKVLYLDCDIIVRKDIGELYKTDVTGYYCAGAEDIIAPVMQKDLGLSKTALYINAGVMLLNIDYCLQQNIPRRMLEFIDNLGNNKTNDQEMLNYLFQDGIKPIDITWNCMIGYVNYYDKTHYEEVCKNPAIVHYITYRKPWKPDMTPAFKEEYFHYLKYTPYFQDFMLTYQIEGQSMIIKKLNDLSNRIDKLKET